MGISAVGQEGHRERHRSGSEVVSRQDQELAFKVKAARITAPNPGALGEALSALGARGLVLDIADAEDLLRRCALAGHVWEADLLVRQLEHEALSHIDEVILAEQLARALALLPLPIETNLATIAGCYGGPSAAASGYILERRRELLIDALKGDGLALSIERIGDALRISAA